MIGLTLTGKILNQMNEDPPFLVTPGETWFEGPGCHHVRAENTSAEEGASFYAVFLVDDEIIKDGYGSLVVIDEDVKEAAKQQSSAGS